MEYQFISYVESTGKDVDELTEQELEEIRNSYLNGKKKDNDTSLYNKSYCEKKSNLSFLIFSKQILTQVRSPHLRL